MGKDSQTNILDQDEDFSVECSATLRVGGFAFVYNQYYCAPVEQELKFTCSSACS